ncbi:hypothetical protein [Halolamina rubra]|uniref:hypothetical protein n=1 Tax=Halolamina rubra TaxID=1380430 RepID=UPI000678E3C4|nr:hypothetical protein [Halolamina rubra]
MSDETAVEVPKEVLEELVEASSALLEARQPDEYGRTEEESRANLRDLASAKDDAEAALAEVTDDE